MKNLYVEFNKKLIYIGYIQEFVYQGETLYKVERAGMFTQVYNKNELKTFLNEHSFIIENI
jgi:hypothetical protein